MQKYKCDNFLYHKNKTILHVICICEGAEEIYILHYETVYTLTLFLSDKFVQTRLIQKV